MGLERFIIALSSGQSGSVDPPTGPVNIIPPSISYLAGIYTASPGTWTGATTFTYQWKLNGVAISGATGETYEPDPSDEGEILTVTVTTEGQPSTSPETLVVFYVTLSEDYIDITPAQALLDAGTPSNHVEQLYAPRMLYHDGKTYFVYCRNSSVLPFAQAMMSVFSDQFGFDRPITIGKVPAVTDTHNIPAVAVDDDDIIWLVVEDTHTTPLIRYKSLAGPDTGYFSQESTFGTTLSYPFLIRMSNGNFVCWSRGTSQYEMYVTKASAGFGTWGAQTQVSQRPLGNDPFLRHYPGMPWGRQRVGNTCYCLISCRKDDGILNGDTWWYRYYVVTTEDFVTYTNLQGTYSRNISTEGVLTDAILNTNFKYYETATDETSGGNPVAGVSATGDFYAIVGHSSGTGWVFITFEAGAYVVRDIDIPGVWNGFAPTSVPFRGITVYADNDIQVVAIIDNGTFVKPHLFKTADKGITWEDLGDMIPEITDRDMYSCLMPNNISDIPANSNFPIYFGYRDTVDNQRSGLIAKVASRGAIQSFPGETVTPAVSMNYNSTGLFHYICNNAGLTKTGNNVTAAINQFGLGNGTAANNPQWNGSDTVTFTGASSQRLTPANQATLCGKGALTYIIVCKYNTGVNAQLMSFANTANGNSRIGFNTLNANAAGTHPATIGILFDKSTSDDGVTVFGQDDIDDGNFHVLAFTIDHRSRTDLRVDGKLQYFEVSSNCTTLSEWQSIGKGPSGLTTAPNTCNIAAIDRSTDVFTDLSFKEAVLFDGVLPEAELKSRIKKLCDDYSITYRGAEQYQIPS